MRNSWLVIVLCVMATPGGAQVPHDPTDSPIWHAAARGRGMPAVLGDRAFATTADHTVVALSLVDGAEVWRRSTEGTGTLTEGFRTIAADGVVVVGDWDLHAFRADTGERLWTFRPTDGYGPGVYLGQQAAGVVYSGSPSGSLYALDLKTGQRRWRAPVNTDVLTSVFEPATDGRVVVASFTVFSAPDRGGVIALEAATGRERWRFRFPLPDDPTRSTFAAGGVVLTPDLALVSSGDGQVWALALDSGAVRWVVPPLEGPFDGIITTTVQDMRSLAVDGDRLVVGSLTGYVIGVDLNTRREVWRVANGWLGSVALDDFTVVSGVVYVPYVSGFLVAIDVTNGQVLWQTRDDRQGLAWPPAPAGDRVVAAGGSGFWALPAARTRPVVAPPPQEY